MYQQVETDKPFVDWKNRHIKPIATLASEHGGRVQITEDDHCIVCFLAHNPGRLHPEIEQTYYTPIDHLFPELFDFLKTMETPSYP